MARRALYRELHEELEPVAAMIILKNCKKVFVNDFVNIFGNLCRHFIFESIVSGEEMKKIEKLPIKEGVRGKIFTKQELTEEDFFY